MCYNTGKQIVTVAMSITIPLKLSVTYSLISSKALQEHLLPLYCLPKGLTVTFLYQGIHDTYLIQGPSVKFILRIYRAGCKTFEQVRAELHLLLYLQEQGLTVSYPIADIDKAFIQLINSPEGERYAVVFSHAEGEKLLSLNPEQALLFGRLMANIHLSTKGKQIENLQRTYSIGHILENTSREIAAVLQAYPEAQKKLSAIYELMNKKLPPVVLDELKTGICHGDPHYQNIFIEPSTEKVTIYDFDFSGNGYLLYDVGSFCFYERNSKDNIESFLEGYTQVMPLSKMELKLVPYFRVLMRLFHLGARSKNADGVKNPMWFSSEVAEKIYDIEKEAYSIID